MHLARDQMVHVNRLVDGKVRRNNQNHKVTEETCEVAVQREPKCRPSTIDR